MRPDEHKKRKNTQYKKAHGIGKKAEADSDKTKNHKKKTQVTPDEKKVSRPVNNAEGRQEHGIGSTDRRRKQVKNLTVI